MNRRRASPLLFTLWLLVVPSLFAGMTVLAAPAGASATASVTGTITGPSVVSTNSINVFHIYGYGGPAVAQNGTVVGNISYYVTPVGPNLSGVRFTPSAGQITSNTSVEGKLIAGNATETVSLEIEISSTYKSQNVSTNISTSVTIVTPYVVSATIVNPSNVTVSGFPVYVTLDGSVIGEVNVSGLAAGGSTRVSFSYPTRGLSSGSHTFALSLVQEHGLVTFAGGGTVYSVTVYVTGPAPDYTLWYVAGIVAFFGAIFIFVSRVAARRRGSSRR